VVTLDQVKLLEAKVAKAIGYLEKVNGENTELREKLGSYQKRIDELEVLIQGFKEDQGRIEESILSALDRLNKFEDAVEQSLGGSGLLNTGQKTQGREKKAAGTVRQEAPAGSGESAETGEADKQDAETEISDRELDIF
jgi:hypothetical protein